MSGEYVEEYKKLREDYRKCTICQVWSHSRVMYDLKHQHIILMQDLCLSCILKHSIDIQNHHNIQGRLKLPEVKEQNPQ